jgi:arsenate reductase (thioredoxin)
MDIATGRPLDAAAASARALQISALTDPVRVRLLSLLLGSDDAGMTVEQLAVDVDQDELPVLEHLTVLTEYGLAQPLSPAAAAPQRFLATADAYVRFGRLLSDEEPVPEVPSTVRGGPVTSAATDLPSGVMRTVDVLAYRFERHFSRPTVEKYVRESYELLARRARVTQHLSSLTTRFATDRLTALATAQGSQLRGTPEVLLVCVQNAGRSQMAAGILRQLAGERVHVRTAGSRPAATIDRTVIAAMDEIGVPLLAEFPKPLTEEVVLAADYVITMGCGDACPVYPGRRYMDWPIPDPVGLNLSEVRAIRDDIESRVRALLDELGVEYGPLTG